MTTYATPRWTATGPGRWSFAAIPVPTPTPNNVTASMMVDAFNDSPWAPGDPAVDVYDVDIVDHVPTDHETWEITGTVTVIRRHDLDAHLVDAHLDTGEPVPCVECHYPY
jgi:hypothetical protein